MRLMSQLLLLQRMTVRPWRSAVRGERLKLNQKLKLTLPRLLPITYQQLYTHTLHTVTPTHTLTSHQSLLTLHQQLSMLLQRLSRPTAPTHTPTATHTHTATTKPWTNT